LTCLAGCSLAPQSEPNVDSLAIPDAWSQGAAAASTDPSTLAAWWARFDDPLLTGLVIDAMRTNTTVASARGALRQARALRDVAAAALFPTLGGSASVQRSRGPAASGKSATTNSFQAGLDANWELDIFGVNRHALNATESDARASADSLGNVQVSIAAEVALAYITMRGAQARLAIANDNLSSQQETLQITRWRQQAGLVTELETEQARTATEQTSALLPALQNSIAVTGHALAVLTGRAPAALLSAFAAAKAVPQAPADLALSTPADTLRQRADVRAAEQQVRSARSRVSQAEAARLPSFAIGGSLGLSALALGSLTQGSSVVSTLLGSVTLPLLDGGARRAQVQVQEAAYDQSREAYRAAVLLALQEVEDALVTLQGDRERLTRLVNAADAATNASAMARQRYGSGLIDFQTVLDTQRTQLGTQDGVATAQADVSSDHVRLYKALGGGWTPDPNTLRARSP